MGSVIRLTAVLCVCWPGGHTALGDYYYQIDVDDILKPDLMPANLLLLDGPEQYESGLSARSGDDDLELGPIVDASVENALATMSHHRKKIHEYFCNNFVAADLLDELMPKPGTSILRKMETPQRLSQVQKMLYDEGSKSYKAWLAKNDLNSGHEDFKRQNFTDLNQLEDDAGPLFRKQIPMNRRIMNGPIEEIDNFTETIKADSKVGYGGYYDMPHPVLYSMAPAHHVESHDNGALFQSLEVKDMFEITMTILAFLSFGTFALQVIMCLTMSDTGNTGFIDTSGMVGGGGGGGAGGEFEVNDEPVVNDEPNSYFPPFGEVEVRARTKRNVGPNGQVIDMNNISRRILKSIDAVVLSNTDKAKCLRHTLCELNKYSRSRKDTQKYWIPVWGLGLTWLSSRVIEFQSSSTSILDGLRASVVGLGDGDCGQQFRAESCGRSFQKFKRRR